MRINSPPRASAHRFAVVGFRPIVSEEGKATRTLSMVAMSRGGGGDRYETSDHLISGVRSIPVPHLSMKLLLPSLVLCAGGAVVALGEAPRSTLDEIPFDAVAHPNRIVNLGAATDGLIAEVAVDRGDLVQVGQVVATLDVAVGRAQTDLSRAHAARQAPRELAATRLEDARRRLAYQEELLGDGYSTPDQVESARTEVRIEELALANEAELTAIAKLELARAEALLAQGTITSPVCGVVIERYLSPGEILSRSGQAEVVSIAELDPLLVEVHVPIELFERILVGDSAEVAFDAPGAPRRGAEVTVKDRVVDTASRTFRVRLSLPNPDYALPAGLRCRVTFRD